MSDIKSSTRLALSAGLITVTVIWLAVGLNLLPHATDSKVAGRMELIKSASINAAILAEHQRQTELQAYVTELCGRTQDIESCGVRDRNGKLMVEAGSHPKRWQAGAVDNARQWSIPLVRNGQNWGQLEIRFQTLPLSRWERLLIYPLPLMLFCGALVILLNWSFLSRTLRHLNPAKAIPQRVRSAFDALTDGLVLIDTEYQVVMANQAFERITGLDEQQLRFRGIDDFVWEIDGERIPVERTPWHRCLAEMTTCRGQLISVPQADGGELRYAASARPIITGDRECRGVLVSFHDVTAIESKKEQMSKMLVALAAARDEVQKKNRDLQILANTDALTGCMNRRSFFDRLEAFWQTHPAQALSVIMIDIDHFKAINDHYGHASGDAVLQETGTLLMTLPWDGAIVGRYGGEEFVVALPNVELDQAFEHAESIRRRLVELKPQNMAVTMSLGVSARDQGAMDCQHLIDQADQCLYLAKREGRNRVKRWDHCRTSDLLLVDKLDRQGKPGATGLDLNGNMIQYPAVTAMLSALAFRDRDTAVHSARVARLCMLVGGRLMKREDLYELEIAAILHDVGKIGVPDGILRKPGPLTPEEWQIMNRQDQVGVEIVRSAFASERIVEYIRCHHLQFANALTPNPTGEEEVLPLGARIISVCDAYDSMTNDRVYRRARTPQEAFAELYRWSGVQFDPLIVRTLERVVSEGADCLTRLMPLSQSLKLGAYVENLTAAIASKDLDALASVTKQVAAAAAECKAEPVVEAATKLELQISGSDSNIAELTRIADEILEFCRASRAGILDNPCVLQANVLPDAELETPAREAT